MVAGAEPLGDRSVRRILAEGKEGGGLKLCPSRSLLAIHQDDGNRVDRMQESSPGTRCDIELWVERLLSSWRGRQHICPRRKIISRASRVAREWWWMSVDKPVEKRCTNVP